MAPFAQAVETQTNIADWADCARDGHEQMVLILDTLTAAVLTEGFLNNCSAVMQR